MWLFFVESGIGDVQSIYEDRRQLYLSELGSVRTTRINS